MMASILTSLASRQQAAAARIACKSKSIQAAFETRQDCVSHFSKVQPKVRKNQPRAIYARGSHFVKYFLQVKNSPAMQKALLSTLLLLEEIEELLDTEEK